MSNMCECKVEEIEECKIGFQQSTFMEILAELNRLKLENEMLKADKLELMKENDQLRNDIEVLHNELEVGSYDKTLFERESSELNDEYSEYELTNAYAIADKYFKIV